MAAGIDIPRSCKIKGLTAGATISIAVGYYPFAGSYRTAQHAAVWIDVMKRLALALLVVSLSWALVYITSATAATDEKHSAFYAFPGTYPLWLARILAPLGVADAQAAIGFMMASSDPLTSDKDPCKGMNYLLRAAKQHQLFAETQVLGFYHLMGEPDHDLKSLQKAVLWYLHFQTHFPDQPDDSRALMALMKFTPEQESTARDAFATWDPQLEPPLEPASCPLDPSTTKTSTLDSE